MCWGRVPGPPGPDGATAPPLYLLGCLQQVSQSGPGWTEAGRARAARLAQVVLGVRQARLAGLAGAQVPRDDLLALGRRCALRTARRSDAAARAARAVVVLIPHRCPKAYSKMLAYTRQAAAA